MMKLFVSRISFWTVLFITCRHHPNVESFTLAPIPRIKPIPAPTHSSALRFQYSRSWSSYSSSPLRVVRGAATKSSAYDDNESGDTSSSSSSSLSSSSHSSKAMAKEILTLGLPALGGVIIDPIMSLADTACVGQISSLQLAAMAPCTSICQFIFRMFWFLTATTTTLVAANPIGNTNNDNDNEDDETTSVVLDEHEITKRKNYAEQVLSSGVWLALVLGTLTALALCIFSDPLLILAGCPNLDMLKVSRNYLRIRALGLPFVLVATTLQGACLGRQDAWTPTKIFVAAGIFNVFGDILLALKLGWGVTGTAIATVIAQVLAGIYYVIVATRRQGTATTTDGNIKQTHPDQQRSSSTRTNQKTTPEGVALKWNRFPKKEILQQYGSFGLILGMKTCIIMTTYSCMTRCAAVMETASLAAHLVALQVWWLISYLPEPVTFAGQSLVARDLKDRPHRIPQLLKVLLGMGVAAGALAALLTGLALMTPFSRLIVADPSVRAMLIKIAPWAIVSQVFCAAQYAIDSSCLGLADIQHTPLASAAASFTCLAGLFGVYRRGLGVAAIWKYSNIFFIVRSFTLFFFSKNYKGYILSDNKDASKQEDSTSKA